AGTDRTARATWTARGTRGRTAHIAGGVTGSEDQRQHARHRLEEWTELRLARTCRGKRHRHPATSQRAAARRRIEGRASGFRPWSHERKRGCRELLVEDVGLDPLTGCVGHALLTGCVGYQIAASGADRSGAVGE